MMQWLLLAALAPAASMVEEPQAATPAPLKIDILVKQPAEKCDPKSADEIIVCAEKTDNESQRLRGIPNERIYGKDEYAAEFGISENIRASGEVESEELQQGIVAKRIMARVKIKF
jgi:hypothetical protein